MSVKLVERYRRSISVRCFVVIIMPSGTKRQSCIMQGTPGARERHCVTQGIIIELKLKV
jgi:hypothetical protein